MKEARQLKHRYRKSKIILDPILQTETKAVPSSGCTDPYPHTVSFSSLRFLLEKEYIVMEDYLIACKYIEMNNLIRQFSGGPKGFGTKVAWHNYLNASHVSWIQKEFALLDKHYLNHYTDDELYHLWKHLQSALSELPSGLRHKFDELLFAPYPKRFHEHLKLYLKAFEDSVAIIKIFMRNSPA